MYSLGSKYYGLPPRLYRSPSEIRLDMISISEKIKETEQMLSVHNLLVEMIPLWAEKAPEKWIPELCDTLAEAEEALENLELLRSALEELTVELEEVKCMMWIKK